MAFMCRANPRFQVSLWAVWGVLFLGAPLSPSPVHGSTREVERTPAQADTLTLVVVVVEAGSDQPLLSTMVRLVEADRSGLTNPRGEVQFTGLSEGEYTLEVESFGYTSARMPVTLPRRFPARVGLAPAPIQLEGLIAEGAAVLQLEERRRSVPMRVESLSADQLRREFRPLAEVLAKEELGLDDCTGLDARTIPCLRVYGRSAHFRYCLDERRFRGELWELDDIRARDLYSVEVFRREDFVIVYLLSQNFVDRKIREGSPLSAHLPCYAIPDMPG